MKQSDNSVKNVVTPANYNESELVQRAKCGDRSAFGELVRHHRSGVINVVYRMCGDIHLAEDAAQEAFIRAWGKLPGYRPRSPFQNWLYRIATNVALDTLRRERETVQLDAVPLQNPHAGPESAVERAEQAALVREAVLALPPASRAVLVLREYEGLSYRHIAETLGIPLGTVMSRLNYARTHLAASLSPLVENQ
jgi:RNA polymerase sigma-70 factor (ECF subfamily)